GRKRRDQMDAVVLPFLRRQRRSPSASCARLQSRQFPAYTSDARAGQGLVADEPEGKADQDWREDREPQPLRRLSDGRGRHSRQMFQEILQLIAELADAAARASMRRPMLIRSSATGGRTAPTRQGEVLRSDRGTPFAGPDCTQSATNRGGTSGNLRK